jgi:AAA+ ATPase superfamily predicted ATPase
MFVKRTEQRRLLEEQYASSGNSLVILYGRKGMGKTTLLSEFLEGKSDSFYYEGTECSDKLQQHLMSRCMAMKDQDAENLDYPLLFSELIRKSDEKTIIVLDEFHYIIKNSPDFVEVFHLLQNPSHPVMFLLCSSSIRWAENDMIKSLGASASFITAFIKLKEFTFVDLVNRFEKASVETCIHINAILGGIPEYLDDWQESQSVMNNIKTILLNKNSRLFMAPQQFLKLELREPAVYNTILFALAEGNRKLNDLHARTGFSRAKISVYLKNLIELDLVEKLVPLNAEGKENVQKGLYRIKDNFLNFWYRFIFANVSELMLGNIADVYDYKIAPYLSEYLGEYFADVCTEFLKLMNLHKRLPQKFLWWERWYGKNGTIDILAQGEDQRTLVGKCLWEDRKAEISDLEQLISLSGEAGISPDYCYLFSKGGFAQELCGFVAGKNNLMLIKLEDL